ncbi:helix-turn-helix domain-containing protein [Pseudomonas gingeri]|uniref:Helix-turn-helix domain-containing protein n=1 Tax=Pseudomonas gingeri TaxID=117681 RepID=A0A7Y7X9E1_9PSED|nr:helix-turn-helix domain-containing protein [Pseudomonas gingeri]NWA28652.1 helix-turn-helix domain-containing protein [Pseudomonas gingeri]NWB95729.1 helix-turn-helix domain-containing protein [Pseudomonas gingeri]
MLNAFNTCQIDHRKRLAYWTDAICETFLTVDCRQQGDGLFHGEMKGCQMGRLGLIDVVSPPMEYYRGPQQLKGHEDEHFQLILQVTGTGMLQQHGREAVLMPGDLALYSATAPSSVVYPKGSRTIAVKIPRLNVLERIHGAESMMALSIKANTALGSMMGGMVRESLAWGSVYGSAADSRLVSGMLDIIAFAFDAGANPTCELAHRGPIEQIKRYMLNHLADPELLLTEVAIKHNISMRTLNRLFAAEGTSANRWLWSQRVEASYRAMSEGKVRQVSEAALICGFNDLSHFSKVFKKTYGITPNQVLRGTDH